MISKALNDLSNLKLTIALLLTIITAMCILCIHNRSKALELENELARINKELYLKQITYERRMKEFEKQVKEHEEQIEKFKLQL